MQRTITVRGVGHLSFEPDQVDISIFLKSQDFNYDKAMELESNRIQKLEQALWDIDFSRDALKTINFNVRTDYDSLMDRYGNYTQKFKGYIISHQFELKFNFNMERLSNTLSAIAACPPQPELNIAFTVRDKELVRNRLLRSIAINAKRNAEILCKASGTKLGSLLTIDYNWDKSEIYSNTHYGAPMGAMLMESAPDVNITPEDIEISDSAVFVWEIA